MGQPEEVFLPQGKPEAQGSMPHEEHLAAGNQVLSGQIVHKRGKRPIGGQGFGQEPGGLQGRGTPGREGRAPDPDVEPALSESGPVFALFGQPGEALRNPGIGVSVKREDPVGGRGVQHAIDLDLKGTTAAAELLAAEVVESVLRQDLALAWFQPGRIVQGVPGQWTQGRAAGLPSQLLHERFQFDRRAGCWYGQCQPQQDQHEQWLHASLIFQVQVRPTGRSKAQRQRQPPPSARGVPGACRPPASERYS